MDWASFSSTYVTSYKRGRFGALAYPDVTVCNLNTLVDDDRLSKSLQSFCDTKNMSYNAAVKVLMNRTDMEFIAYGSTLEELIDSCDVAGERCKMEDWNQIVPYGAGWGVCYTLNTERFGRPEGIGIYNSISIKMSIETSKYCASISDQEGVRVTVHERGSFPDPNTGVTLAPAEAHALGLRVQKVKMAGWPYTRCEKDHLKPFYDSPEVNYEPVSPKSATSV